jgi:hypothetical protein
MRHPVLDTNMIRNSSVEANVEDLMIFIHDLLVRVRRARISTNYTAQAERWPRSTAPSKSTTVARASILDKHPRPEGVVLLCNVVNPNVVVECAALKIIATASVLEQDQND